MTDIQLDPAELLVPALRWREADAAYRCEGGTLDEALALGVGGFVLFGGTVEAARALVDELRARSRVPLLIAADLERGAGQQLRGATQLPPLRTLGAHDAESVRRAAALTAREARAAGVTWALAPVCDVDLEPTNPIVGARAFGPDPREVAALAAAWIAGCQEHRVVACAKHFPGHGRTTADSQRTLPVVEASRVELEATDLVPFRAAIDAGVASIMTAHVRYPSLCDEPVPATLAREILMGILRRELGFTGLVVSDALDMRGVLEAAPPEDAAVHALQAGCDLLLMPVALGATAARLRESLAVGAVSAEHVRQAIEGRRRLATWTGEGVDGALADDEERAWAASLFARATSPPIR